MERETNISNFIGVYDNYILPEECDRAIKLFEDQNKFNNTMNRMSSENSPITQKQDKQFFASPSNLNIWWEDLKTMIINYDMSWSHYMQNTGANTAYDMNKFFYTDLKIQKTLPTEGYHVWHVEHGKSYEDAARAFVFSIYLNDVEEGGETEFPELDLTVTPKCGTMLLFPSTWTYLHRGNTPISNDKYILGSYLHYV